MGLPFRHIHAPCAADPAWKRPFATMPCDGGTWQQARLLSRHSHVGCALGWRLRPRCVVRTPGVQLAASRRSRGAGPEDVRGIQGEAVGLASAAEWISIPEMIAGSRGTSFSSVGSAPMASTISVPFVTRPKIV